MVRQAGATERHARVTVGIFSALLEIRAVEPSAIFTGALTEADYGELLQINI